jgi:hypothetical protein
MGTWVVLQALDTFLYPYRSYNALHKSIMILSHTECVILSVQLQNVLTVLGDTARMSK